jgi:hypothetical protein
VWIRWCPNRALWFLYANGWKEEAHLFLLEQANYQYCGLCAKPMHKLPQEDGQSSCFFLWHDTGCFGLAKNDWKITGKKMWDWTYPTMAEMKRNEMIADESTPVTGWRWKHSSEQQWKQRWKCHLDCRFHFQLSNKCCHLGSPTTTKGMSMYLFSIMLATGAANRLMPMACCCWVCVNQLHWSLCCKVRKCC